MKYSEFDKITEDVRECNKVTEQCRRHYDQKTFEKEIGKLSGEICYNSVQYYTYLCGIFKVVPKSLTNNDVIQYFFIEGKTNRIENMDRLKGLTAGFALIFTGVNSLGEPNKEYVAHAMVTSGSSKAMGSNNGFIGGPGTWTELDLQDYIEFGANGVAKSKKNKDIFGYVCATKLCYLECKNQGGCRCAIS